MRNKQNKFILFSRPKRIGAEINFITFSTCLIVFFLLILNSCTYDNLNLSPCNDQSNDSISFNNDIIPLFNNYCNTSGCHSGTSPEGGLNLEPLEAYTELMKPGKGYIDTINPKFSILYIQMKSTTQPMPPTGNLDPCQIEMIFNWIKQNARNNWV